MTESEPATRDGRSEEEAAVPNAARRRRFAFAVLMWACGIVAIQTIPVDPFSAPYWDARGLSASVHPAWITPFAFSVALVWTGLLLLAQPRVADKAGAVAGILLVGWWPGWLALCWWTHFATR